jgi:hypothetical protein
MDMIRDEQRGEVTSSAPTTYGCGFPFRIAPGQKEREVLWRTLRSLPDEVQIRMPASRVREGVNHGNGQWSSAWSIGVWGSNLESKGAWPWAETPAITSEPGLGGSVGVGTASPRCKLRRVSSAS